jgi:hypothetical protein
MEYTDDELIQLLHSLKERMSSCVFQHKNYGKGCFFAQDAIPHIAAVLNLQETSSSSSTCVRFGNLLLHKRYIFHVTHSKEFQLEDKETIYRFNQNWKVAHARNKLEVNLDGVNKRKKSLLQARSDLTSLEVEYNQKPKTPRQARKRAPAVFLNTKFPEVPDAIHQIATRPKIIQKQRSKPFIDPELKLSIVESLNNFTKVEQSSKITTPRVPTNDKIDAAEVFNSGGKRRTMEKTLSSLSEKSLQRHSITLQNPIPAEQIPTVEAKPATTAANKQNKGFKFTLSITNLWEKIKITRNRKSKSVENSPRVPNNNGEYSDSSEESDSDSDSDVEVTVSSVAKAPSLQQLKSQAAEVDDANLLPMVTYRRISRKCTLMKVLYYPDIMQDFKVFAQKELSEENIIFWELIETHYKRLVKEEDRIGFGIALYKLFIPDDSPYCLNVSGTVKRDLKEGHASGAKNAFFHAQMACEESMQDTFKRFKTTEPYKKWMANQRQSLSSPDDFL